MVKSYRRWCKSSGFIATTEVTKQKALAVSIHFRSAAVNVVSAKAAHGSSSVSLDYQKCGTAAACSPITPRAKKRFTQLNKKCCSYAEETAAVTLFSDAHSCRFHDFCVFVSFMIVELNAVPKYRVVIILLIHNYL